ncbi:MAG: flagellar basal-body rod protein FlgG [Phycisphaerae bacterium]|nr:flagellar basal-body rod protein FlgG [Phycisphaerae bacterium]
MGTQALYTAATGMKAMDFKLNVVAHNLANIETVAFKRSRANFEDVLYQTLEEPGQLNGLDVPLPTGKQLGLGVHVSGTQLNFEQGPPQETGQKYDLAINGAGFFQVQAFIDGQETTVYTRAGNFTLNVNGEIVLANSLGARLEPAITIPQDATDVTISPQGLVQVQVAGTTQFSTVGQIELADFINPAGLKQLAANLYKESDASGPPVTGNPIENGMGSVQQNYLEMSNVDPVRELVELIHTQRSFELNSQSIQSADQTLQTVNNLRR